MNKRKYLKGACQHCGGHLEFLADHIGMVVPCPHCQMETELLLLPPPEQPTITRRALVWTAAAILILGLGFAGALIALKRAQRWAEGQRRQLTSAAASPATSNSEPSVATGPKQSELSASSVILEKTPGSSLVYAVGTIRNTSARRRFGIKVELELVDEAGQKIGTASDYRQVLEPGAQWDFKALVVQPKTASAKILSIREDQ